LRWMVHAAGSVMFTPMEGYLSAVVPTRKSNIEIFFCLSRLNYGMPHDNNDTLGLIRGIYASIPCALGFSFSVCSNLL
jgi:hypothetical protein